MFQLLTVAIFLYQMQNSIRKYIERPTTQHTSTTTLDKVKQPVIYICQDNQFNYSKAKDYGYSKLSYFYFGIIGYPNISWNSKHENRSFKYLQQNLYQANYSKHTLIKNNIKGGYYEQLEPKEDDIVFRIPVGFCWQAKHLDKFYRIQSTNRTTIYLTDPLKDNMLMIPQVENGKFSIGMNENGFYDNNVYKMKLSVVESGLKEGQTCIDYEKRDSSYGDCLHKTIKDTFLSLYGCLPPWFPKSNELTCGQNNEILIPTKENLDDVRNDFSNFYYELDLLYIKPCLPPCKTMKIDFIDTSHATTRETDASLKINIQDEVTVYKEVHAYDMFDLVVDLGSALGLWLGLSALSILDSMIEMFIALRERSVKYSVK